MRLDGNQTGHGPNGAARPYPAEKARQGRIVLDTPLRRYVFIGGLILMGLFALAIALLT